MVIQKDSWAELDKHLPCSSCIAGRFQKRHKTGHVFHSNVQNLAVSCSSPTSKYTSLPNQTVSTDWGIVNKPDRHGNTVFALYLDADIGVVYDFQAPGRGLAGESLEAYIQQWGTPECIIHDNAQEYLTGKFADICRQHRIQHAKTLRLDTS